MLKKIVFFLIAFAAVIAFNISHAGAVEIKKGTISLAGSSDLSFSHYDHKVEDKNSSRSAEIDGEVLDLSIRVGYFLADNLEIGAEIDVIYEFEDGGDDTSLAIGPFVKYHIDLNENSNLSLRAMVGVLQNDVDNDFFSGEFEGTVFSAGIGWEYFFNCNVAGTIGLNYFWKEWDEDYYLKSDGSAMRLTRTESSISTYIGLIFYF